MTVSLVACGVVETFPEYPGKASAVLEGFDRLFDLEGFRPFSDSLFGREGPYISSVDGMRPKHPAQRSFLTPGAHWIEVTQPRTKGGHSVCAFEADFRADHEYKLVHHSGRTDVHSMEHLYGGFHKGNMTIALVSLLTRGRSIHTFSVDTLCAPRGSATQFCRKNADCEHVPDSNCRAVPASSFGVCSSRDR